MYRLQDWAAIQRVYKQTQSIRETARILQISRNTVKKLLKMKKEPSYNRTVYKSCLDGYKEQIVKWRCEPYRFNGTRIFKELQKTGYTGSIGPVYRFLQQVDEDVGRISSRATVRVETPPGDQAQFDWSEYSIVVGNRERRVYCFAMILAASRKKAVCFSLKVDAAAVYEAIQELFEDLGGVTLELLIDNPKALVSVNNPKSEDEVRYNPQALMLAKHLGTELNACPCYWPRKKGKIEAPFHYIEEQFIKGNTFATMEELNRRGKEFVDRWCDEVHGTTKRIPNQHYLLEEKEALLPLPRTHYRIQQLQKRIISPDSYISIGGSRYSVPVRYVGKALQFRITYGFRIELYDMRENPVLTLEISNEKHTVRTDPVHYEEITKPVSTSIPQIRRDFSARFTNGQRYLDAAARKFDQPTHHARKIMLLADLYDDVTLDRFIGYCVDHDKMDIRSFKGILRDYNAGKLSIPGTGEESVESGMPCREEDPELTRDCSYYEVNAMKEARR